MGNSILIVEDDKNIVDILSFNLEKEGYSVRVASDGISGLEMAVSGQSDLILLDVMLPGMDGFEVCRRLRQTDRTTPVIMLTAREEETDKIFGLDVGADDYITKPFSMRELLARVRANFRRMEAAEQPGDEGVRTFGRLCLDNRKYEASVDGRKIEISMLEYELLRLLASNPGRVFSREELLEKVWGYTAGYYGDMRTVDVAVARLRDKIEDNPKEPVYILTRRGAGYYFNGEQREVRYV